MILQMSNKNRKHLNSMTETEIKIEMFYFDFKP